MDARKRRKTDNAVAGGHFNRFGAAAVHMGIVTLEELKAAMVVQVDDDVNGREHRLLGSILFDRGLITAGQIDAVLTELNKTAS